MELSKMFKEGLREKFSEPFIIELENALMAYSKLNQEDKEKAEANPFLAASATLTLA